MNSYKNKVDPEALEKWFVDNREIVYTRSVETARQLVNNLNLKEEILFEFYWDEKVYSKIFMARKDIRTAMDKALNFFVSNEMFEKAQEIKNLMDRMG